MSRHLLTLLRRQAPARHIQRTMHLIQRRSASFGSKPTPNRLPAREQAEFERLQRDAAVSSVFRQMKELQKQLEEQQQQEASAKANATTPSAEANANATAIPSTEANGMTPSDSQPAETSPEASSAKAAGKAQPEAFLIEGIPGVSLRKGSPPEFEGDTNPKTGEVDGPKNEPLRWGPKGDYSYNGRVTDF